jgi:SWI/SNF-related matrix-associated actin-dependent regulator of chromatin subfamily A3
MGERFHDQNRATTDLFRLNLTAANRVFIMEPQWNPSVESQAIGRAQRYRQTRPVQVIRYIVQDSVEEVSFGGTA